MLVESGSRLMLDQTTNGQGRETGATYFARIRQAVVAVLLACVLIVHFGPLRPVHEWFR